jgi:hypothetical protein
MSREPHVQNRQVLFFNLVLRSFNQLHITAQGHATQRHVPCGSGNFPAVQLFIATNSFLGLLQTRTQNVLSILP